MNDQTQEVLPPEDTTFHDVVFVPEDFNETGNGLTDAGRAKIAPSLASLKAEIATTDHDFLVTISLKDGTMRVGACAMPPQLFLDILRKALLVGTATLLGLPPELLQRLAAEMDPGAESPILLPADGPTQNPTAPTGRFQSNDAID